MKKIDKLLLVSLVTMISLPASAGEYLLDPSLDLRLRYEAVEQDNLLEDADALTLRTTLKLATKEFDGWSGFVEFEDVRTVLGFNDYNTPLGQNPGYSVIADPETTELDQGFIQYKNDTLTARLGRQVITLEDHRFVGHVAWRQDKQTFDAISATFAPAKDLSIFYAYLDQRNRIFAEERDIDSKDHILHADYQTPFGKVSGYTYLLEVDNDTDNAIDTYGVRFGGKQDLDGLAVHYLAEIATQTIEAGAAEFDTGLLRLEGGLTFSGNITAKLGYEVLGSDDGAAGFATPLATLHKFNGWADQFLATPAQGLVDTYVSVSGSALNGKWLAVYHDFSADDASPTVDDLGNEVDVQYTTKINDFYLGAKIAFYSAGDIRVDTDKFWFWIGRTF